MDRKTLTVEEAAEVLGVGRSTAYQAIQRGEIPSIRIGGRILVLRDRLDRIVDPPDAQGVAAQESTDGGV